MERFDLQVLVLKGQGHNLMDAAKRLAKRLERIGLSGEVEGGWEGGESDSLLETRIMFGKKEA